MMTRTLPACRSTAGAVLLVVLWVIALLSFLLITAVTLVSQGAEGTQSRKLVSKARQLAEMGLAVASHPDVQINDALLRQTVQPMESFEAMLSTEEARLNLNTLLKEEHTLILERIFVHWGLTKMEAETLIDRLMDWVDQDDLRRLKGAERPEYMEAGFNGRPFNRRFRTLDEVAAVLGMDELAVIQPEWRDHFTLLGSGQLDINEASAATISAMTQVPLSVAQSFILQRAGGDGIVHTEDDIPWPTVEEALTFLGVTGTEAETLTSLLTVKGPTSRIVSVGRVGDYARGISVVLKNRGQGAQILEWREFVPAQEQLDVEAR